MTFDLANDCFSFVTGYFEVISASSPHIYHTALMLTPKNSTLWKLYQSHVHPFTRVVNGAPVSWETSTAAMTGPSAIDTAVWSPCNRFIATTYVDTVTVDILDPVTLQRLQTLEPPRGLYTACRTLTFSPDSRILTYSSGIPGRGVFGYLFVVSWDLQTGGVVGVIKEKGSKLAHAGTPSITHSADGKMVAVFRRGAGGHGVFLNLPTISLFDVASGACVCSHSVSSGFPFPGGTWIQGDSLRFTTSITATIAIWEVGFTSHATPAVVETLPAPDFVEPNRVQFLPSLCRIALALAWGVQIWDARNSKYLLRFTDARPLPEMTFSSDGCFFACRTTGSNVYLWRESSTGYVLHKILSSCAVYSGLLLSPNGRSIIAFGRTIRLWHTEHPTISPSNVLTQAPQRNENFVLDFSPDGMLAVVAMQKDNIVTVLDLESGVLRSTTNVGMEVYGLRVTEEFVLVVGSRKFSRWILPAADCDPHSRVVLKDCSLEITHHTQLSSITASGQVIGGTISLDRIHYSAAFIVERYLAIHAYEEWVLCRPAPTQGVVPWFAPGGGLLWCADKHGVAEEWVVPYRGWGVESLRGNIDPDHPPEGYPWASSRGYQVSKDWWIRGPDGKRLLMLPPHWQSDGVHRMWKEQFLALLHRGLSEPVILELLNP